jgi:hypothetical protein
VWILTFSGISFGVSRRSPWKKRVSSSDSLFLAVSFHEIVEPSGLLDLKLKFIIIGVANFDHDKVHVRRREWIVVHRAETRVVVVRRNTQRSLILTNFLEGGNTLNLLKDVYQR